MKTVFRNSNSLLKALVLLSIMAFAFGKAQIFYSNVKFDTQDVIHSVKCGEWVHDMTGDDDKDRQAGAYFALVKKSPTKIIVFTDAPADFVAPNFFPYEFKVKKINNHEFWIFSDYFTQFFNDTDVIDFIFKFDQKKVMK